jgi:single-strand DNA-binding protein
MSGNAVQLVGNITRDPELRYTPAGQATATFGLAVNRRWQNRQTQEWEEATSFFDIVCWRDLAEHASSSLSRGTRVIVIGRMEQRSWETQEGDKRSKVEVVADEVGPSLRWATVDINKVERAGGNSGGGNYGNGGGGGGNSGGNSGSSGNSGNSGGSNQGSYNNAGGAPVAAGSNSYSGGDPGWGQDEEPF